MSKREFCYICATKLKAKEPNVWWCDGCKQNYYDNPKPAVEVALFDEQGRVLLAERAHEPWKGEFDMPGGFVDPGETLERAIARELKEELDLSPDDYSKPVYLTSYESDYPWGKEVYKNVVVEFVARLKPGVKINPQDDVASVRFVVPSEFDPKKYSIPELAEIIELATKQIAS